MDFLYSIFPEAQAAGFDLLDRDHGQTISIVRVDVSLDPPAWRIILKDKAAGAAVLAELAERFCSVYQLREVSFLLVTELAEWALLAKERFLNKVREKPHIYFTLEQALWQIAQDRLCITLDSDFALNSIKQKNIDCLLKSFLSEELGVSAGVDFLVQDTPPQIEYEQEPPDRPVAAPAVKAAQEDGAGGIIYGREFSGKPVPIAQVTETYAKIILEGYIDNVDVIQKNSSDIIVKFIIADNTDAISAKMFFKNRKQYETKAGKIKDGLYVKMNGRVQHDFFERGELVIMPQNIVTAQKSERLDQAPIKRVELHAHTKMSKLDAVMDIDRYIECAAAWGHEAVAITDHGVVQAFPGAYDAARKRGIKVVLGMEGYLVEDADEQARPWHIVILAANRQGLFNLYKLVSLSHLWHYFKVPRIPRSVLEKYRAGLILGSACEAGELYQALLNKQPEDKILRIAGFYDYLEIQPNGNNQFLLREGKVADERELCELNRRIVDLGKVLNKPVVATCDAHFLRPEDEVYRRVLQAGQKYADADTQAPLFFRTTQEMLAEFNYLGEQDAYAVVVENPRAIAAKISRLRPIPDKNQLYSPKIPGANQAVHTMSYQTARRLYGDVLPELVENRLKRELTSIIGHGFAELYLIAHKLVKKSLDDGYLVGSRGSVGSSLVAAMMNITEVNPLQPHYRCPRCRYNKFITDGSYNSGFDLTPADCPVCGEPLIRDGHNLLFEVFLGIDGDKVPDIDLNFSGDYQNKAHKYTEELFGRANVFRAGTINKFEKKTAAGFVIKYHEERGIPVRSARIDNLVPGCTGVKRTTGQHPGGVMVVPRDMDVHYFTPVQRPADDCDAKAITTHFDYKALSDRLVKLDILGHDDPTVIKMLEEMIGISAKDIPFSDPATLSLFSSTEALGIKPEDLGSKVGTFGIPEFGTKFVMQMLEDTRPRCFSDLVRISGYSHGTNVWRNNAQDIIKNGVAQVAETIAARDDIMQFLMQKGVEPQTAFTIMETVRKGKGVSPEYQAMMRGQEVPEWYIASCQKIEYLFPKAHAVAYVMMACRIAYCKAHHPLAFYAACFTRHADDFDAGVILAGHETVVAEMKRIADRNKDKKATDKEKSLLSVLELANEMYLRGIYFKNVSLRESHPINFTIADGCLLPPLCIIAGLGEKAAYNIAQARQNGYFLSKDELRDRAGINKTVLEQLAGHGCLKDLPDSNQLALFTS